MTARTIRSERLLPLALCVLVLSGCGDRGSGNAAPATVTVAGTSESVTSWGFSDPEPVDAQTALDALISSIELHADDYAGASVQQDPDGGLTATVHLVPGTNRPGADVSSFMAAASAAGIDVRTDMRKHSLSELDAALTALPQSAAFSGSPDLLVSAKVDVDSNAVEAMVSQLTPQLTAAVRADFGSKVNLTPAAG